MCMCALRCRYARTAVGVLLQHLSQPSPHTPLAAMDCDPIDRERELQDRVAMATQARLALVGELTPMRGLLSLLTVAKLCLFRGGALPLPPPLRYGWALTGGGFPLLDDSCR